MFDAPFLKNPDCALAKSSVPADIGNGLSCAGSHYGVGGFKLDQGFATATGDAFYEAP